MVGGLADELFVESASGPFPEGVEMNFRVGRDVSDPETLGFRRDCKPHSRFRAVVRERLDVGPCFVVITDNGRRVGGNGAAVGLVVVFAGEADEIDS